MSKTRIAALWSAALLCCGAPLGAQQAPDSARRQLDSLKTALRALEARLESVEKTPPAPAPTARGAYMNVSFVGLADAGWSSARDVPGLQRGHHDPKGNGFTIPNAELSLDGAVDPFFKAYVNIVNNLSPDGETNTELEEAYFITSALPHNLQLKLGQFNVEFGRENQQHPHAWAFADQPLVLNRMFGADGLRGAGARLSWLLPTSVYTEATLSVINSAGESAYSFRNSESSEIHGGTPTDRPVVHAGDMLWVPRLATSFDLTNTQTIVLGASAAMGPNNSGPTARTAIFGGDVYWKWKSARADAGFPFVAVQSEYLFRRYDAAARTAAETPQSLQAETLHDAGAYAQIQWGIRPRLVAALRGELASGDKAAFENPLRDQRTRIAPSFTWFPTEFSKIRLQYNYDDRFGIGKDHSLWMQFEFLLGAHAAHKF